MRPSDSTDEPPKILLIDDNERLVRGLAAFLRKAGYHPFTASSGAQGLYIAAEERPDLIICDVMMPSPDGFEVRELLNQQPDFARIPFIFVTARDEPEHRLHGIEAGADDYITKPFNVPELRARIEAVLRRVNVSREEGANRATSELGLMRREILRNFTHELRTPLSHIMLSLKLAMKQKFGEDEQEHADFISSAVKGAERLHRLIDDLLFLAAYDRGDLTAYRQRIRIDFHFLDPVQKAIERWHHKRLEVSLNVSPDLQIYAPRNRFRQAVDHLIDNACKFSPEGGHITVDLQPNDEGGCLLTVIDEGPGIPPQYRERVFERYYQISQGDGREYDGLGVGLTIARAVARSLGGDVTLPDPPSDAGAGCVVRMIIPPGEPDTLATQITNR
jgi:signal transduction histidine kinase